MKSYFNLSAVMVFTATGALAGSPVTAVDDPAATPPTAASPSTVTDTWTGAYIGLHIISGNEIEEEFQKNTYSAKGYGAHAGYLHDMGSFVLGAEITYDHLTFDIQDVVNEQWGGYAIAGYDAGNFLPYVTGGVSRLIYPGGDQNGYGLGAGVMFKASDHLILDARYQRTDYSLLDFFDIHENMFSLRASYKF